MRQASNPTTSPDGTASLLVAALERTWQIIRTHHPAVPEAVLVVASGAEGKRLNLGSIQDTSRQGRYHNRRYATLAGELGLEVASVKPIGWSATTVPDTTAAAYAGQLEELQAALVLWRRHEHRIGPGTRSRNLLAAACPCGRRIRAAKATLAEAPIVCGACAQPFQPADPDEASN
jgi:hypothetical protein